MFKDETASNYDLWYQTRRGSFIDQVETEAALQICCPDRGAAVLDAGCGTGNFSLKLASTGCKVTGIDVSEDMLAIARHKAAKLGFDNIGFLKMDIHQLAFPEHTFDVVFSMAVWEFIPRPREAFDELWRVLRPGGQLLIGTINRESPWGHQYMQEASSPGSVFLHASFKSMDDLKNLNRDNICGWRECLYIPPQADDEKFCMEAEEKLAPTGSPGFIIVSWQKPLI